MNEEDSRRPRPLLPNLLNPRVEAGKLMLTSDQELNDASWGAWFGQIQQGLRLRLWDGQSFSHCHVDMRACPWADPLPLMSLSVALAEFERTGGSVSIAFASLEKGSAAEPQRLLKYMAREGFMSVLAHPDIAHLPTRRGETRKRTTSREVLVGDIPLTYDVLEHLKNLNVPLAFERSTCLPATLIYLHRPLNPDDIKTLDDIDQWVERKLYEAIEPVVSVMVPGWAQRGVRYRLLMALREMLHNVAEHAYEKAGFAAVYVRYREGALGEAPVTWQRLEKFIRREQEQWKVPLMAPPSERESFPKARTGFFEVFVLDSGEGLCKSLGELSKTVSTSPLQKCMLDIFDYGRGRRTQRPTQYGGLFLLRQLLEPVHDYLRIRDEDAWWGTELPLKRTETGSTPAGPITTSARGAEHTRHTIEGVAWTARLSWLDRTDLVWPEGQWQGLTEEGDKPHRNALMELLREGDAKSVPSEDIAIVDSRFSFQRWTNAAEFVTKSAKVVLLLPRADWMKNHIQREIADAVTIGNLERNGVLIIGDIPSEEATTYLAAIENSSMFVNEPLARIRRVVLITRDIKACVLERGVKTLLSYNDRKSKEFMRAHVKRALQDTDLIAYYSALRYHDGGRLWNVVQNPGGAYLDEKVRWSDTITLDGYLDFPQSLTHPVCRGIYTLTLQRLMGLFHRHDCELMSLDGLVDSLVVRFNAEHHSRSRGESRAGARIRLCIGSVQVSGLTERLGKEEDAPIFHFFRHPSGSAQGRYLLPWMAAQTGKILDPIRPYRRVGRTPVIARDGWKAYRMPRYDVHAKPVYEQAPRESYRAWQEPSRTPLKIGHWSYGGHHDLLTLNLLLAFDTELDRISLSLGGSLARFLYANLFRVFGLTPAQLNEKGRELFEAVQKDHYRKLLPETLAAENALLLYPSHPVTDHVLDRFLSLVADETILGEKRSPLDRVRSRLIAVLPVRRHRSGSGLQISGLILEKLSQFPEPKPPLVMFDDALISGRTYADLKRLLRSMGFLETYSLAMVDRQRFPSGDHVEGKHHFCYWRLDLPSLGGMHNCPLCQARRRVGDLADDLTNPEHRKRVDSWRDSWRPLNPATQWGDGGLLPIPLWLNKPERKFSIEPDPDKPGSYRQIGGDKQQIQLTNTAGLVAYVSELHSITSHDDLALRILGKEALAPEARIQLLASQLLLFSSEFDRDLASDLAQELMTALWDAESHDRHTALAVLTLVGCGDKFLKETIIRFFDIETKQRAAVTRSIDVTLLLAMVLLLEKFAARRDPRLFWLSDLDAVRGLLKPRNKTEVYGWLHRLVADSSGKSHSAPLHRLKNTAEDPEILTSAFLRTVLLSVGRLQSILEHLPPYWLRADCDGHNDYDAIQGEVKTACAELTAKLNKLLSSGSGVGDRQQVLEQAKVCAAKALSEAGKLHDGAFTPLGIDSMKSERDNMEPVLLGKLRDLRVDWDGKLIRWHSPSPYEMKQQLEALNKPEAFEVYVLWDAALVQVIGDILTNARHVEADISNPWNVNSTERAHLWGRVDLQKEVASIELCNLVKDPEQVASAFNARLSPSRAFLVDSGGTLRCTADGVDKVLTCIHIPYAHTLRATSEESNNG